jgi:DNA-binding GntR family transcriptional regulator
MRPLQTRRLLAEDVADRIREEILAGRVGHGERLVEVVIAEELGVSRGPVREALKLLNGEGLVTEEPHRGAFVTRLNSSDVRDIFDLRAALEAGAARQIAARGTPSDIHTLRRLVTRVAEVARGGDAAQTLQADLAFHESVCQLSGNRRLLEVYMRHVPLVRSLMDPDKLTRRDLDDMVSELGQVLEAIEAGDGDLAAARFAAHAGRARDMLDAHVDGHPEHA